MKIILPFLILGSVIGGYIDDREAILAKEDSLVLGSNLELNEKENLVNGLLLQMKHKEIDEGFHDPSKFMPSRHFYTAAKNIENSEVFKFIRKVPKGASLHSHDSALVSGEFLYNLTLRSNLFGCVADGKLKLHFYYVPDSSCDWKSIEELRQQPGFDDFLKSQISTVVDNPYEVDLDINVAWERMENAFSVVGGILKAAPIWKETFYKILEEFYEDNVMYIEVRTSLSGHYDANGTIHGPIEVAEYFLEVVQQFKQDHPDFQGVRVIYAKGRSVNSSTVEEYAEQVLQLRGVYGDFIAGFDLVGQEDLGRPLIDFLPQLQKLQETGMKFIFHAGETNWYGTTTDINLIDAVLLNTTRIGHGYAILKHPEILRIIKERGIAIEISPISNQVLKLVSDMRNHPGNFYMANGYPVVICNDDPSFWGSKALSYDWYEAFMGMTSRSTGLKFLKQLALNSYLYNMMSTDERELAIIAWSTRWNTFIDAMFKTYSQNS